MPAAEQTLAMLSLLARAPSPLPAARISSELGLPRSTTYHLLAVLTARGFVVHLPEERRYGLGVAAVELGSAYARQAPLARLARPVLARLVEAVHQSAHLAVLHGRDVVYVVEERAPGKASLVTDVGVRLPAHLTASGRAILAALPARHVTALFPNAAAFVRSETGPSTPTALRRLLVQVRNQGFAVEWDEVTPGFASRALPVLDHNNHPVAGIAVTWSHTHEAAPHTLDAELAHAARVLGDRVSGRQR